MWGIAPKAEPVTKTLIPAIGDRPAVTVTFNPQPTPKSLRIAREAVAAVLKAAGSVVDLDALDDAGDAFSTAIIRHNIVAWSGIGCDGEPVEPTHDVEIRDDDGVVIRIEPGTISGFLGEPRLVEAADREYVQPWVALDLEKNGYAPAPSGTSAGEMPGGDIAGSSVVPMKTDDASPTIGGTAVRTPRTRRAPKKVKRSGR